MAGRPGKTIRTSPLTMAGPSADGKTIRFSSMQETPTIQEAYMHRIIGCLILISCLFLPSMPAVAHHAFATEFDGSKPVSIKGIVTKIEWTNPHVWFYLNVKNETGTTENWGFEMGG